MFELHSRVQRIFTPTSYRDITIHEMTESEIKNLKGSRWLFSAAAFVVGILVGAIWMIVALPRP